MSPAMALRLNCPGNTSKTEATYPCQASVLGHFYNNFKKCLHRTQAQTLLQHLFEALHHGQCVVQQLAL